MNNWDTLESTKPTMARTPPDTNVYNTPRGKMVHCCACARKLRSAGRLVEAGDDLTGKKDDDKPCVGCRARQPRLM